MALKEREQPLPEPRSVLPKGWPEETPASGTVETSSESQQTPHALPPPHVKPSSGGLVPEHEGRGCRAGRRSSPISVPTLPLPFLESV